MEQIRIGKDLKIEWALYYDDGRPFSFGNCRVDVEIKHQAFSNVKFSPFFQIVGNIIKMTFPATRQTHTGTYTFLLVWSKPDPEMPDSIGRGAHDHPNAFELVASSSQEGGNPCPDINLDTLKVMSSVRMVGGANVDLSNYYTKEEVDELLKRLTLSFPIVIVENEEVYNALEKSPNIIYGW